MDTVTFKKNDFIRFALLVNNDAKSIEAAKSVSGIEEVPGHFLSPELYDAYLNLERLVSAHCDLEGAAVRGAVQRIRNIRTKESQP